MSTTKIVVIDDSLAETDPIIVEFKNAFGDENVVLKRKSSEGLKYVLENIGNKMIVMLDLDLGAGEPHGVQVFEKIRSETSLVYIIIITAKQLNTIDSNDLIKFINNNALAIINNTEDIEKIIKLVQEASHVLDTRIDCVLEEWILNRPLEERKKLYLSTRSGQDYTLEDIVTEIRHQTTLGKNLEKGILQLAIELLTKGKEKIND